jgi:hypothetical protein
LNCFQDGVTLLLLQYRPFLRVEQHNETRKKIETQNILNRISIFSNNFQNKSETLFVALQIILFGEVGLSTIKASGYFLANNFRTSISECCSTVSLFYD